MERSEWPDDDAPDDAPDDATESRAYPPAPLPAHERQWRHPSEVGRAVWTHTEPPITIGRGLLVTTGAIGGLLSLAVLWAMLPSVGRDGQAAPSVVTSRANDPSGSVITVRPETLVATSLDTRVPSTTTVQTAPLNAPASEVSTTTLDRPQGSVGTQGSELVETPVAVGIGDSLVITTARAVRGRTSVTVTGTDGQQRDATVLMVDTRLGIAVLSADPAATGTSYGIGPAANPGDVVIVMGATPASANVGVDALGRLTLDSWAGKMAEGTPVVNAGGLLVGMCSHGSSGPELVSVANVGAMLPPPAKPQPAPWLGVHVVANDQGVPTIDAVDPSGPAAAVGLVAGDVIVAVDGTAVLSVDQLKMAISGHVPADIITLTVTHADQTSADVAATLGAAPSM
ncbi:MAG: PDZ domain-containing protein [Ilumatobacteraceae bacterium]